MYRLSVKSRTRKICNTGYDTNNDDNSRHDHLGAPDFYWVRTIVYNNQILGTVELCSLDEAQAYGSFNRLLQTVTMDPFPPEPYRSARLLYRAPEDNPADDAFFHALYADPVVGSMATTALLRPLSTKERKELRAKLSDVFMSVMICIIPDEGSDKEPETIGVVSLKKEASDFAHNRTYELGISIARQNQDKGYGSEAISWMLDWAFLTAGLHRVELVVAEWNERAQKVYRRLGFASEGRKRQCLWKAGRWWDLLFMGILAHEWEAKKAAGS
ncbi:hypothetical protein EMGR_008285 [Emarellia grisea]